MTPDKADQGSGPGWPDMPLPPTPVPRTPMILALSSACLAAWASKVVLVNPGEALWLFVVSAFLLLLSRRTNPQASLPGLLSPPRESWELPFFIFLIALAACLRLMYLNSVPAGAVTYEGEMFADISNIMHGPYTPHSVHQVNRWPTLFHYESLFFTKLFGWNLGAMRTPAAIWSLLGIAIFYFLARRITSPLAAAWASLFYCGSYLDIIMARRVFPATIMYFPILAGWLFLLIAVNKPRWYYFVAAGFAAGLSLHSYYPARGVPFLFGGWFYWVYLTRPQWLPKPKHLAIFWIVFLLTAFPVLNWAFHNWSFYWGWVDQVNPNNGHGWTAYVSWFLEKLPPYYKLFHISGDPHWEDNVGGLPLLDTTSGAIFGVAVFFCAARFWDPINAFIIAWFLGGLVPAVLGGGFPSPNTRRAVMLVPALYLGIALVLEQWRLALWPSLKRSGRMLVAVSLAAFALYSVEANAKRTFVTFYQNPQTQADFNHASWIASHEFARLPKHHAWASEYLLSTWASAAFFFGERNISCPGRLEDLFLLDPKQDHILALDPFLEGAGDFFKDLYPGAEFHVYRDESGLPAAPMDPFNHGVYVVMLEVPKKSVEASHGLLAVEDSAVSSTVSRVAFSSPVFGKDYAGRRLHLKGSLVLLEPGAASTIFSLPWRGWKLSVDGKPTQWKMSMQLGGGTHSLELEGMVPTDWHGAMPIQVLRLGVDMAPQCLLAIDSEHAWMAEYYDGDSALRMGAPVFRRREVLPIRRYWDPMDLKHPFSVRFKARLRVPTDGDYRIRLVVPPSRGRVVVDGKVAFDNFANRDSAPTYSQILKGARDHALSVDLYPDANLANRNIGVEISGPEDAAFKPLPREWIWP